MAFTRRADRVLQALRAEADARALFVKVYPDARGDLETAPKLLRLIDMLEDCDDVQNVYHNGEISDEVAAQL